MAPSGDRNVKLIVSATAAVPSRIVDTFGQRANDDEDTQPAGKQSSKMAAMMKNGDCRRVSYPVGARAGLLFPEPAGSAE